MELIENTLEMKDKVQAIPLLTKQSILPPCDSLADVGLGVRVSRGLTSLSTEKTVEVGSLLVRLTYTREEEIAKEG